ncbi:hypothetical protein ACLKA6_019280 [Drosophila palustris]
MKLWKSKKPIGGCVPGKSSALKQEQELATKLQHQQHQQQQESNGIALAPMLSVDRAMSPAQSEDSGLAPERGTTYATITLPRNALHLAINFAERNDLSYPPVIGALNPVGHAADFLAPGDRLHQIDGISTIGLSNQKIMNMLCAGAGADPSPAIVEIEYSLPECTVSQNSLYVTSKLAQITVERESGCLGLTLRGGADYPLIVTHVRLHGPVYKTGRIKPGDRLLRVDNISLIGKTLAEAQQIIKCGHVSGYTNLTIEYDVSVVQSVEFSMGPLLIEIERPMNDKLGLVLCNYSSSGSSSAGTSSSNDKIDEATQSGIHIASILPASIADRCGALSVGDQVLSIDDTMIEHTAYSPDEVMTILDTSTGRGYTQMQIMPAHALARRGHTALGSPKYSFSTLESRKSTGRQRPRIVRKSSLPLEAAGAGGGGGGGAGNPSLGLCRAESFPVLLDCSQGAGIILGNSMPVVIAQIVPDSVADRSGCIQPGDRIVAINKMYSLDAMAMRQLLEGRSSNGAPTAANWLELEVEFDMPDAVVPSSGVFNVKLLRAGRCGLGVSVSGSSHAGLVISDVKMGSPAHRCGSLRPGDILLAVDQHPVQHFNVDALLKELPTPSATPTPTQSTATATDFTTLTIKRVVLPDFLQPSPIYSNCCTTAVPLPLPLPLPLALPGSDRDTDLYSSAYVASKYAEVKYNDCISLKSSTPQPDYFRAASLDDTGSLQSVQLRHPPANPNASQCVAWTTGNGLSCSSVSNSNSRNFAAPPNQTQSMTTELPEEEDEQEDQDDQDGRETRHYGGYELNRYAR